MKKLILASESKYRAESLRNAGFEFTQIAADIDERAYGATDPEDLSLALAAAKCAFVAQHAPGAVVIGSDQVGWCQGEVLTKPGSAAHAHAQLARCQGQEATFYTSVSVYSPDRPAPRQSCVMTHLQFRELTIEEITGYVSLDNPIDCAGAFKIEAHGLHLFEQVRSDDPSALIGLPMLKTQQYLREAGINPLARVARTL